MLALLFTVAAFHDVRIHASSADSARALARERLSLYRVDGSDAYAVAPDETIAALTQRGFTIELIEPPPTRDAVYRTREEVNATLTALADTHKDRAKLERLGTSRDGTPILALRIGPADAPAIRVLGGHHGDEGPGVEVPLRWLESILADTALAPRLAKTSLLVAPLVNPDGYSRRTRYNAAQIDLNRNYAFAYRSDEFAAGPYALSEPETRAVALDNDHHRYATSLTFHTGALNIGYPYNYTTTAVGTDTRYAAYATAYKQAITAPAFYVTRGAQWFISYGDCNDHSYGYFGGADFTVEMSTVKLPPAASLDALTTEHGAAATAWLAHADEIVRLEVRDATSDEPLPALIESNEVATRCDPITARTQLLAAAGTTLHVSLPGYMPQDVAATYGEILQIRLERSGAGERVRVVNGFASAGNAEITLGLAAKQKLNGVRGLRPGADDIVFDCDGLVCTAPAAHRRPGHYALVASLQNGGEVLTPNAFYVADETAGESPFVDGAPAGDFTFAAWVEHGGGAGLYGTDQPASERGLDLIAVFGGALHRIELRRDANEGEPIAPVKRGCGGCGSTDAGSLLALLVLVVRRRRWQ